MYQRKTDHTSRSTPTYDINQQEDAKRAQGVYGAKGMYGAKRLGKSAMMLGIGGLALIIALESCMLNPSQNERHLVEAPGLPSLVLDVDHQ